jgi:hypothetical protein
MCQTTSDECRTTSVHPLLSSPQVVSGDPSPKGQDGFPITNVGNDREGDGFPVQVILSDIPIEGDCSQSHIVRPLSNKMIWCNLSF